MKQAYKLNKPGLMQEGPEIVKADLTDVEGVSWREVKRQLRAHYTSKARALRALREKDIV